LINDEINKLQKELAKMEKDVKNQKIPSLLITLESDLDSQDIEIQLEYTLEDASERNIFYNLHIQNNSVRLAKWVSIVNKSAEKWENVLITITDKILSYINFDFPRLSYVDAEKGVEDEYIIPVQTIHMGYKVNISPDSLENKFELYEEPIKEKKFLYLWNAIEFKEVTEILILSLQSGYLYPGLINIMLDGQFIDYLSHNDFTPPGEKIAIPIRSMPDIAISKKALDKTIKEIGMISKQVETNYSYLLSVTNPFIHPVTLVIYEQIPKPNLPEQEENTKFRVKLEKISSVPFKVYTSGMVRWDIILDAKATQEVDFNINLIRSD
jgi:hypothetical protein